MGEVCEDLAVYLDVHLLEGSHELRVGEALGIEGGVYLYDPEAAAIALLVSAVGERVGSCVRDGLVCGALVGRSAETVSFNLLEDVPPRLESVNSFFYSCHGISY